MDWGSFPIKGAFFPFVDKAYNQNGQKNNDGDETCDTDFLERHCPWKEESDFEVEEDEQNGHQILANIKLHARIFKCFEAAFIRGIFCRIRAIGAKDVAQHLGNDADGNAYQDKQQDRKVLVEVVHGLLITAETPDAHT